MKSDPSVKKNCMKSEGLNLFFKYLRGYRNEYGQKCITEEKNNNYKKEM